MSQRDCRYPARRCLGPPPAGKGRMGKGQVMTGADYIGGEYADLSQH